MHERLALMPRGFLGGTGSLDRPSRRRARREEVVA